MNAFIEVSHLKKHYEMNKGFFRRNSKYLKAVDDISFTVSKGESLAVIGESGSGKTTLARLMTGLITSNGGEVIIDGIDILKLKGEELRKYRLKMSMVFQNPAASLNPHSTIGEALARPLLIQGVSKKEAYEKSAQMLDVVKLDASYIDRYPHRLSGGQQQRVSIARALIVDPAIMILDEPTSAVDISVQSDILNLLLDLQTQYNLTYLFITHNLNVVRYFCDNVLVMYLGKAVEYGSVEQIFKHPAHPYTLNLFSSMPIMNPKDREKRTMRILEGDAGSLSQSVTGCRLYNRCPIADDICERLEPPYLEIGSGQRVLCHKIAEASSLKILRTDRNERTTEEIINELSRAAAITSPKTNK
jgi:oligopeptide/dipeptide ABC transporter ATP-binding protein